MHAVDRNALVRGAVEAEYRRLHRGRQVDRVLRCQLGLLAEDAAVPGDGGLERRVMRGIEPGDAAAPAEAGDAEPRRIAAIGAAPGRRVLEEVGRASGRERGGSVRLDRGGRRIMKK